MKQSGNEMTLPSHAMTRLSSAVLFTAVIGLNYTVNAYASDQSPEEKCAAASGTDYVKCLSDVLSPGSGSTPAKDYQKLARLKSKKSELEIELAAIGQQIRDLENSPQAAKLERANVYIKEFGIGEINSAGGVEPYAVLNNPNRQSSIKYLTIRATLYNAVGDVIGSSIGGRSSANLHFTGPLESQDGDTKVNWKPIWYNSTADCIRIDSIQVTFLNGKVASFSGNAVRMALPSDADNDCRLKKR